LLGGAKGARFMLGRTLVGTRIAEGPGQLADIAMQAAGDRRRESVFFVPRGRG